MFSHKRKERLANKISKIKRKKDLVKVYEIIQSDNDQYVENNNGLFFMFHSLKPETYKKLEKFIVEINNKRTNCVDSATSEDKLEYKPYAQDEFSLSPKLKYSNKEKNLIKRRQYDKDVSNENVVYKNFDVKN